MIRDFNSKCFVVLGMHRSATSLCGKGLHESGVSVGKRLLGADPANPEGYYEDTDFMSLNKKILSAAGGDWKDPPPDSVIQSAGKRFAPEIKELVSKKQAKLWGWKDPRTTLTVKLYLPYIENPHFFCCFRDPQEVAESLKIRNNFSTKEGLTLARIYNRRLMAFLREITEKTGWSNITL